MAAERDTAAGEALTGIDRAAAFLLMLGEREASEILRYMEPADIHRVANAMTSLPNLSQQQVKQIVAEFCRAAGQVSALGPTADAQQHIRKLLVLALGQQQASEVISRVALLDRRAGGIESLARREPREIADMLRDEHPQVIATLLAYLDSRLAGQVLALLPGDAQKDILLRMATLENVPISAMEELNALVEGHLQRTEEAGGRSSVSGGPKVAAGVLNGLDSETKAEILESIKDFDEALGETIENSMFTFEDLLRIDDRAVQALLAEVSSQVLCTALKGADETAQSKFFSNMSRRAAEMLREDIEVRGPVRLSEVEAAQREIVETARRMMDAGTIVVGGIGGSEDLVY